MKKGIDPSNELDKQAFEDCDIVFTDSLEVLRGANFFIVAVLRPLMNTMSPTFFPFKRLPKQLGK
jgi:UDP-N-acetyl-D-galactosamine dehydrogenase